MKIWTSKNKNDDKIIAYINDVIYKGNPPVDAVDQYAIDLQTSTSSSRYFFNIPLRYISKITARQNSKYIIIYFRGDTENLKIEDDARRKEIFEYFKANIPNVHTVEEQSRINAIKKPLIALIVAVLVCSWSLYIAVEMEQGAKYDVTGKRYYSMAGIILMLASMGVTKLITIFGILFVIIGINIYKKYKNPVVENVLWVKH